MHGGEALETVRAMEGAVVERVAMAIIAPSELEWETNVGLYALLEALVVSVLVLGVEPSAVVVGVGVVPSAEVAHEV